MNSIAILFEWLLAASLRASVLAVVVLGIQFVLRHRLPAAWRHALWLPMLAVLVLPVLPEAPFALFPQKAAAPVLAEMAVKPAAPVVKTAPAVPTASTLTMAAELVPAHPAAPAPVIEATPAHTSNVNFLAILWLAGAGVVLGAGWIGYHRNMRRIRATATAPDRMLLAAIAEAAHEAGLSRAPRTWVSAAVSSPAVTGFLRPLLLLPAGFPVGFNAMETRLILLHEFSHLKRLDLPLNWLMCLLQAMHWFNPLLWFAFARMRADRESACDARVLSIDATDRRAEYGGALLKLQCAAPSQALSLGFVGIFEKGSEIKARIREISTHRPGRAAWRLTGASILTLLMVFGVTKGQEAEQIQAAAPAIPPAILPVLNLPGIEINVEEQFVDVAGTICLESGALEVIACTKDTKEHEAIVLVEARPSLIHAALLLVGAKNGNPAMRRTVDKEMTRWVDIPATKGDPIYVSLVWKKEDGTTVERPISDFLERSEFANPPAEEKGKNKKFPEAFLFAGSHLGDPAEKTRKYLAEFSGVVISISTFGDELLCLPDFHGKDNNALDWQIDSTHLPKLNSKVTLRLRTVKPKGNPEEAKAAAPAQGKIENADAVRQEMVTVAGFVCRSGPQPFTPGLTIFQAVAAAGGPDEFGNLGEVVLKRDKTSRVYDLRVLENLKIALQPNDIIKVTKDPFGPGQADAKPAEAAAPVDPATAAIKEKLKSIIIPTIEFKDISLEEAVNQLRLLTKELDFKEPDDMKKGVNFVIRKQLDPSMRIGELRLKDVSCETALRYIAEAAKARYTIDDFCVTLVPQGEPDQAAAPAHPGTVINILSDGTIKIGGGKVDVTQLHEKLASMAVQNKNQPVFIRGGDGVTYQRIVEVVDTCQKAGIWNISFATQKPEPSK